MRNICLKILLIAAFSSSIGCSKNNPGDQMLTSELHLKTENCSPEAKTANSIYKICFVRLITDSRCPSDAVCVWAGYAQAEFSFVAGQQIIPFKLSTLRNSVFNTDTTINNIKISLLDILPHPSFSNPAPANTIEAVLQVR